MILATTNEIIPASLASRRPAFMHRLLQSENGKLFLDDPSANATI